MGVQPLLPLKKGVLLPHCQMRLSIARPNSIALIDSHVVARTAPYVAVFTLMEQPSNEAIPRDRGKWVTKEGPIFAVGCVAQVVHVSRAKTDESYKVRRYGDYLSSDNPVYQMRSALISSFWYVGDDNRFFAVYHSFARNFKVRASGAVIAEQYSYRNRPHFGVPSTRF